ncbi:sterigmatocystin 8-O-methyltransferase [Cordyceps fumosorosea ARSEF 2679]|uniref:Sterigmatocystin 8-O-methyltransferase n=1 Tax=Cordyceps fumosorosea (strain ARSEF 2679) TaxID=1081104 RepID=A0A162MXZ1_CORFA|nr:sterigmatocystin 8-O-methyltransferase [Cordyceps fumosorosea ARSEF 2679]OAA72429.1 sterigmatocystin 8-O-methyltransferase [Cordyceps fumosorosea ARSEF 2679]
MSANDNINGLAAQIAELASSFTKSLADANIAEPDFTPKSATSYEGLTGEQFLRRQQLLDKINDIWYLVQGPSESIFNYVHTAIPDIMALNLMNHFDFWAAVPLDGSASFAEIAAHAELPEEVVQRVIEHGMTLRLFAPEGDHKVTRRVRHSSRSAALVKSSGLRALVSTILDDAGAPMLAMNKALELHARGQPALTRDMTKTAFAMHQKGATIGNYTTSWEYIENDGEGDRKGWRQRNFVEFMRYLKEIFRLETVLENAFDWKALGKSHIVDMGGSGGHDAFFLAERFPELTITVEDLPEAESVFNKHQPAALQERVKFIAHDFFNPQPVQPDVFLIKLILHDWPDEECVKILRGLVPAMRPGSRVFFLDFVGKQESTGGEEAVPRSIQQMGTATDLRMMALFNAEERPAEAWRAIFKATDERFDLVRLEANPLSFFVVIEAVWRG